MVLQIYKKICPVVDPMIPANHQQQQGRQKEQLIRFKTFIAKKAEELEIPAEIISGILTSLQLMGNANYQHSLDP